MPNLTDNQQGVLDTLAKKPGKWLRPMDCGGTKNSHHSRTLAQLYRKGLAVRRNRASDRSFEYMITSDGMREHKRTLSI